MKYFKVIFATTLLYFGLTQLLHADYNIVNDKGAYGVVDTSTGEFVIRPQYEKLERDKNGYIAKKYDLYGVIDNEGQDIIKFQYNSIYSISAGYIVSKKFEEYAEYGRRRKKYKVKTEYEYGVIGPTGDIIIPIDYSSISATSIPGIFKARKDNDQNKYGIININNEILLPLEYKIIRIKKFGYGNILVTVQKGYKEETIEIYISNEEGFTKFKNGDRYGYKNSEGQEIVGPIFEDAFDFKNNYARVKKDGKWGFINSKGDIVVEIKYDYVWDFEENKAKARLGEEFIYLDKPAEEIKIDTKETENTIPINRASSDNKGAITKKDEEIEEITVKAGKPKSQQVTGTIDAIDVTTGTFTVKRKKGNVVLKANEKAMLDMFTVGEKVVVKYTDGHASFIKTVKAKEVDAKEDNQSPARNEGTNGVSMLPRDMTPDKVSEGKKGVTEEGGGGFGLTPLNAPEVQHTSYFASIKRKIELVWQYPYEAAAAGVQGELTLDFVIARNGTVDSVELIRGSGSKILDDEAIRSIQKAAPFDPIPTQYKIPNLRNRGRFVYVHGGTLRLR